MNNPFEIILDKLNNLESMVAELQLRLDSKPRDNSIEMAMRITGYRRGTIYNLVKTQQIPHSKNRRKLVFDETTLIEWAKGKSRTVSSNVPQYFQTR